MKDGFVQVAAFSMSHEAHLAKTFLESRGIAAEVLDEHTINMNWLYSNAIGGVKLIVPGDQAEAARAALKEAETGLTAVDPDEILSDVPCPKCQSVKTELQPSQHKGVALLALLSVGIVLPFFLIETWKCHSCGHTWRVGPRKPGLLAVGIGLMIFTVLFAATFILYWKLL